MNKIILLIISLFLVCNVFAAQSRNIPRFVTTKSDHVNARKGPGATYPINWILLRKSEPLKVIAEFEDWRKIEDMKGYIGWIHSSVLSGKRSVIITCNDSCKLYNSNSDSSRIIAEVENGLRCSFDKTKLSYLKVKCNGHKGWIESKNVWGLLEEEISNV
jgi:SH3-like domain-containing protein